MMQLRPTLFSGLHAPRESCVLTLGVFLTILIMALFKVECGEPYPRKTWKRTYSLSSSALPPPPAGNLFSGETTI
jgi:hypothetical protein